jgi:hypothetical protein
MWFMASKFVTEIFIFSSFLHPNLKHPELGCDWLPQSKYGWLTEPSPDRMVTILMEHRRALNLDFILFYLIVMFLGQVTVSISLISALEGSLQRVSRRSSGRSRPRELGRSGLARQLYERTRQPEGWVRESYPKLLQRHHSPLSRGSRTETNASTYYVPAAQRRSLLPVRGLRDKHQGNTTATTPRYTSANARYLSIQ